MFLVTINKDTKDCVKINDEQYKKLSMLYNLNKLPKTFKLNGHIIVTEDIFGFSDKYLGEVNTDEGFNRFRDIVSKQAWYKRAEYARLHPEPEAT